MPTFPSHWAACSGSIEEGETPYETSSRELQEETNILNVAPSKQGGLYVDVPFRKTEERETTIRVYPFVLNLPPDFTLELRGTEHDYFKMVSVDQLEVLKPTVPSLALAFHHATHGKYIKDIPPAVLEWSRDLSSGAAQMAQNALLLVRDKGADPNVLKMMRPSMVAITNACNRVIAGESVDFVLKSLETATSRAVEHAIQQLQPLFDYASTDNPLQIATFSRSSTLAAILKRLLQENSECMRIICSKSTPGDEGILMAQDLGNNVSVVDDEELLQLVGDNEIDVVLVGSDCVTETSVVNKIGTRALAEAAASQKSKVYCCTDEFKLWNDVFSPPLEDIFEEIPKDLFDEILMPPQQQQECVEDTTT